MIRTTLCLIALSAAPAFATDVAALAAKGNQAAIDELAALTAPTDEDRMALGMFHFLRGIESTLQLRYAMNMSPQYMDLPLMRLPIPTNPAPVDFSGAMVAKFSKDLTTEMAAARAALAPIPTASPAKLTVQVGDLWFDLNADGKRDAEHDVSLAAFGFELVRGGFDPVDQTGALPVVRFDSADVHWLAAYTHFLSAFGEMVLAYDPSAAIDEVIATGQSLGGINQDLEMANAMDMQFGSWIDGFAAVEGALRQQPDATRSQAALAHLLEMMTENRIFWDLVRAETDNDAEWIPNDRQTAAMGFTLPPGTGEVWQAVLTDGEAVLKGEKLLPYWRVGVGAGLNLNKLLTNPPALDLVGWVQGRAALPYLEKGERMSPENWWRFREMVSGEAMLFAVLLN